MTETPKISNATIVLGGSLALASLFTFAAQVATELGQKVPVFLAVPGEYLLGSFAWAALFIPAWLGCAACLTFLPGWRPAALTILSGSVLPFVPIAVFARISVDPSLYLAELPFLEALGLPGIGIVCGAFALLLSALVAFLAMPFLGIDNLARGGIRRPSFLPLPVADPADKPKGGDPAPDSIPSSKEAEEKPSDPGRFEFRVPSLAPLPIMRSLGEKEPESGQRNENDPIPLFLSGSQGVRQPRADAEAGSPAATENAIAAISGTSAPILQTKAEKAAAMAAAPEMTASAAAAQKAGEAIVAAAAEMATAAAVPNATAAEELVEEAEAVEEDFALPAGTVVEVDGAPPIEFTSVPPKPAAPGTGMEEVEKAAALKRILARRKDKPYAVPVEGILTAYPDGEYWIIDDKTRRSAVVLRETLAEFNIEAEVTGIRKGPVITMFEILPAPGVKLSKITNLSDNIALRLAASSVRIVAPIPGKHAVGIEVPNERRSIVSLREIVENESFKAAKMEIPVILGKDIAGEAQFIDLVQTPHLLIAGATGSGKSVCVNSIILSILYRRSPLDVKLLLIDPKIVELKLYNDIPHLLTPVITEPKRAFQALQYCICEMERRYSMLDRVGVRDVKSYNRKIKEKGLAAERLPYIVVIIDEFADLMATTGKELESTLARLAAMSRAVGIHLVLATQRPSIDVITGLIKANIPSRIAFMVAGKFDSRIIIDMVGAEKLLGRGDMLFASAWDPFPIRMQGAFVSDEEVEKAVEFVKTLGEPEYIDEEIFIDDDEDDNEASLFADEDDDPLYEKALEIVLQQGRASASYIQRRLKIGYNRASRLVELMEEKGIVGPARGSKPRDLVHNPEILGATRAGGGRQSSLMPNLETVPGQRVTGRDSVAGDETAIDET